MKKELIIFNGGLQTKVAPHLAQPNQAIECENIDLTKGSMYPYSVATDTGLTATGYFNILDNSGSLVSSDEDEKRSYVRYGTRIYYTNGSYGNYGLYRVYNDGTIDDATPPSVSSFGGITFGTNISNGNLDGDYIYVYTVVDDEGIESVPSPTYSITANNEDIVLNFGTDAVDYETVSRRNIYRTGGNNPTFNLVGELESGTNTFTDNTRDIDVARIELSSFDAYPPPTNLDYVVESNGTLFGVVDDRVYFSLNGRPEFWNPLDFLVLSNKCTGLGVYRDSVLAFTDDSCYVINGFNRDNITQEKLPYNEGCLTHYSITNITEFVVWTSRNGVCIYNGSTIEVVTRNILSWFSKTRIGEATFNSLESTFDANIGYQVSQAFGLEGKYYAIFQGGIGVFDIFNGIASTITGIDSPKGLHYNYIENSLSITTEDKKVYVMANDSLINMTARWRTPELTMTTESTIKQFRKVEFDEVPLTVDIYVDNELIKSYNNRSKLFLPSGSIGRNISLDIYTNKEIRSMEIQYGELR